MSARESIAVRVRRLMADGKPRTACEIAEAIGASDSKAAKFICVAREPGENQELHAIDKCGIGGKGKKRSVVRYVIGKGENVGVRPAPATVAGTKKCNEAEMTDAELDKKYRIRSRWWTEPDLVVLHAINSMVRMGASHASR